MSNSTIERVREYMASLSYEALFTSRDLLSFGTRSQVDNAVHSLAKSGEIVKATRGVFARRERTQPFSVVEVATVKAQSFGRRIISHAANIAEKIGLLQTRDAEHYFAIDGKTSSFRFGQVVIHLKGISLQKMALGDSQLGKTIRTLSYLGKSRLLEATKTIAASMLGLTETNEIKRLNRLMPSWLSDFFCSKFSEDKVHSTELYSTNNSRVKTPGTVAERTVEVPWIRAEPKTPFEIQIGQKKVGSAGSQILRHVFVPIPARHHRIRAYSTT